MKRLLTDMLYIVALAAVVVALLVLAVVQVNRESAAAVADEARISLAAEQAMSAAAAVRNAAGQAVVLADLSDPDVDLALRLLVNTQREFQLRMEILQGELTPGEPSVGELDEAHREFDTATDAVITHLESDDVIGAVISRRAVDSGYESFVAVGAQLRDDAVGEVALASVGVGRVADGVRMLIVFVIPAVALLLYRRSAKRRAEQAKLAAELERQKQITQSKDDFIADLSHELRTPLTGIYGFGLALDETEEQLTAEGSQLLDLIITETAELTRMVDDLLTAGRIDAGQLTVVEQDVPLMAEITEVVEPFLRRGVAVEVSGPEATVRGDRLRVRQVLRNLVSNAHKYGNGKIQVTAEVIGDTVAVQVVDDGPGVPDGLDDQLFARYVHEGGAAILEGSVGLGLAIADSLTVEMGGKLLYARSRGHTIFELQLPNADAETSPHTQMPAVSSSTS